MRQALSKIEPVLYLLFFGMFISTLLLIFVDWKFHEDGQIFQVVAQLSGGFTGSFFTRLRSGSSTPDPPAHGTQITEVRTATVDTGEPKP